MPKNRHPIEQFIKNIQIEANNLRKLLTDEEKARLNPEVMTQEYDSCFYAQVTDDEYDGERCVELMRWCSPVIYETSNAIDYTSLTENLSYGYTPIEKYLYRKDADKVGLVAFIRDEITEWTIEIPKEI